jgi:hypothetical protein
LLCVAGRAADAGIAQHEPAASGCTQKLQHNGVVVGGGKAQGRGLIAQFVYQFYGYCAVKLFKLIRRKFAETDSGFTAGKVKNYVGHDG